MFLHKILVFVTGLVLALATALPAPSMAASIELRAPDGTCHLDITPEHPTGDFTVVARGVSNATCCGGFSGAELRVEGLPSGWTATVVPAPTATVSIGNLFGSGANIAFGSASWTDEVMLYSVSVVATSIPQSLVLRVFAHDPPSNPHYFSCPVVFGSFNCPCDPDEACATGGALYINGEGDCVLGVAPATWTNVKTLFR
jgi:hypothetical protein